MIRYHLPSPSLLTTSHEWPGTKHCPSQLLLYLPSFSHCLSSMLSTSFASGESKANGFSHWRFNRRSLQYFLGPALQDFRGNVLISRQSLCNHAWTVYMPAVAGVWENYIVCAFVFPPWGFYCILATYYVCIVSGVWY